MRRLTAACAFLAASAWLAAAAEARAEMSLGVRTGSTTVKATGFSSLTYQENQALGLDLQGTVSNHWAMDVFFESTGQTYTYAGGGFRYFPMSYAGRLRTSDWVTQTSYEDTFRPFVGFSGGFGRLRLQTLSDVIEAQEIGTAFYAFDFSLGFLLQMTDRFDFGMDVGYGTATATTDSPVIFSGSRLVTHLGVYCAL